MYTLGQRRAAEQLGLIKQAAAFTDEEAAMYKWLARQRADLEQAGAAAGGQIPADLHEKMLINSNRMLGFADKKRSADPNFRIKPQHFPTPREFSYTPPQPGQPTATRAPPIPQQPSAAKPPPPPAQPKPTAQKPMSSAVRSWMGPIKKPGVSMPNTAPTAAPRPSVPTPGTGAGRMGRLGKLLGPLSAAMTVGQVASMAPSSSGNRTSSNNPFG